MFRSETWSTKKAPNLACLQKCFDAHADDKDNRISHDDLAQVLNSSGARMLGYEIETAWKEMGSPDRIDRPSVEGVCNSATRYLNVEWQKEDSEMEDFNPYQQTYAAYRVLADSYGQNGLIDIVNLRYVLTSCGEEMSDDEFDAALKEIGQSSKGMFQPKKLLNSYHDLALKVGREDATQQCKEVLQEIDNNRSKKANDKRQSRIMHPGMVAPAISDSRPASRAPSEKAPSEPEMPEDEE
jgi:Ca2+-binding EF-hand superfamily protein